MSSKQLARTVVDGRKIVLLIPGLPPGEFEGYLCGMDDFHLLIVTSDGKKLLAYKGSVAVIRLADDAEYDKEPNWDELEKIVGPFRSAIQREHLAPTKASKEKGSGQG